MHGIVKEIHGKLFVESSYAMSEEPTLLTHRYPILTARGRIDLEKPIVDFRSGQGGMWLGLGYEVYTGDSIAVEKTPIAPPKTKLPTRWHHEHWQKYSKSQGWIVA